MSIKGKEEKKRTLQKLLRILWAGNVTEAILYLQKLNPNLFRQSHRVCDLTGYLEKRREHIPCYALRLVVAQRQKHNGMSWSTVGNGALAQIIALSINGELYNWLRNIYFPTISACHA